MRVSDLPLNDLYGKEKITASVEAAICSKEDFTSLSSNYCERVCKLKCKQPKDVRLLDTKVDILIVQDHAAPDGKFDKWPGKQEKTQRSIIEFLCKQAGFDGLTYRVVNLLKCAPNDQDFPRGKAPTSTVLTKCKPYLLQEIKNCSPKVIISLSTAVTKALGLKSHSNTGNRGQIVDTPLGKVVITIHPRVLTMIRQNASGAFWGVDYLRVIQRDFNKAARIAREELVVPKLEDAVEFYREHRIRVASSMDDVNQYLSEIDALPSNAVVSFDTETTGLDGMAPDARVLCIQFGWRNPTTGEIIAVVIPLWHRDNTMYDPDEAWKLIAPLLEGSRGKVAHNGKFDILYIYHTTGVRVRNLKFDTMLVLHSIDSGVQGCYGLKTAVTDFLPDTGLSGYEDLLPGLTKGAALAKANQEGEEQEEDSNEND
jgi:hypothetical protein